MRTVCMELGDRVEGQWEEKLWVMVNTSLDGDRGRRRGWGLEYENSVSFDVKGPHRMPHTVFIVLRPSQS